MLAAESGLWAGAGTRHRERPGGDEAQGTGFRARHEEVERNKETSRRETDTGKACAHVDICSDVHGIVLNLGSDVSSL